MHELQQAAAAALNPESNSSSSRLDGPPSNAFTSLLSVCCLYVLQVVTDNAAACRAAGALIEATYPHITWSPCVAHVCDLALEDIFKLDYFKEVHTNTKAYVTFINNHHHTLSAWRQHQAAAGGSVLQLLKPGETRFASALLMIERTISVKSKLQQFVVSDSWNNAISSMKRDDKVRAPACFILLQRHTVATVFTLLFALALSDQYPRNC